MSIGQITREAVLSAASEYDLVGRHAFLTQYGFGQATKHALLIDGSAYDPKAIVGAARSLSW